MNDRHIDNTFIRQQWHPFCSGLPGSIRCGLIPSLTHRTPGSGRPPQRGEGRAIIREHRTRQAILAKHPLELRTAAGIVGMRQGWAPST